MNNPSPPQKLVSLLAISGSLRAASSNTSILRAASKLAPDGIKIIPCYSLGDLPHFNPDLDGAAAPPAVRRFRSQLREADGVLMSSPEYAHGVPGVLKNALDWIVSSGELMGKPVVLINAAHGSRHAEASLRETLAVMMARVTSVRIPLGSNKITEDEIVSDPAISSAVTNVIAVLADAALSEENSSA